MEETAEHYGRLDVVVQNAHHEGDWTVTVSADIAQWKHIMDIDFFGALQLVQQAVPMMKISGHGGSIVLVTSGAAASFPPTMSACSTSKAALAGLTRTLAKELGPSQIRLCALPDVPRFGSRHGAAPFRSTGAVGLLVQVLTRRCYGAPRARYSASVFLRRAAAAW